MMIHTQSAAELNLLKMMFQDVNGVKERKLMRLSANVTNEPTHALYYFLLKKM